MDTILIVEDSKTDTLIITGALADYATITAGDGLEALDKLSAYPDIDMIILDLHMPNMNGFEFLQAMESKNQTLPIIVLTNFDEVESEVRALELGAVDYIRKPLNFLALLKRVEVHLRLAKATKVIQAHNQVLQAAVTRNQERMDQTQEATVQALVQLLEVRNIETGAHIRRTARIMQVLAQKIASLDLPGYRISPEFQANLVRTAPLHDIGKVGIPDNILLKPGRLTTEEYEHMKRHVEFGVNALYYQQEKDHPIVDFMEVARAIIQYHHERFDGKGYPQGLKGTDIPLPGRLMAIIDVYDALTSERVYKRAMPHTEAMCILSEERGNHFDPVVVDAFFDIQEAVKLICTRNQISQ